MLLLLLLLLLLLIILHTSLSSYDNPQRGKVIHRLSQEIYINNIVVQYILILHSWSKDQRKPLDINGEWPYLGFNRLVLRHPFGLCLLDSWMYDNIYQWSILLSHEKKSFNLLFFFSSSPSLLSIWWICCQRSIGI